MRETRIAPSLRTSWRSWRWPLLGAALGTIVAILLIAFRSPSPVSDTDQLRNWLTQGTEAAEAHDVSALMNRVSSRYKDDLGLNKDQIRIALMNAFQEERETWVNLDNVSIQAQGNGAVIHADVTVESVSRDTDQNQKGTFPVTLYLKKEQAYRYLIFPTDQWRVVKAEGLGTGIDGDLLGL